MTTTTQRPVEFPKASEDEINLWKLQKIEALKMGNIPLATALQFAIDQFSNTQKGKEIRLQISRLPSDQKIALTRILFGNKSPGASASIARFIPVAKIKLKEEEQVTTGWTVDGIQLFSEDGFVKGATLMIVTENGNIIASAGKYKLDTGDVIEVDEAGIIISVGNPVKQMSANLRTLKEMKGPNMIERIHKKAVSKVQYASVKKFIPSPSKPIA